MELVVIVAFVAVGWLVIHVARRDYREIKQVPAHKRDEAVNDVVMRGRFGAVIALLAALPIFLIDVDWLAVPYLLGVVCVCLWLRHRQGQPSREGHRSTD